VNEGLSPGEDRQMTTAQKSKRGEVGSQSKQKPARNADPPPKKQKYRKEAREGRSPKWSLEADAKGKAKFGRVPWIRGRTTNRLVLSPKGGVKSLQKHPR